MIVLIYWNCCWRFSILWALIFRCSAIAVFSVASARAKVHLEHAVAEDPELRRLLDEVRRRELDPLSAVREILEKVFHIANDRDDGTGLR